MTKKCANYFTFDRRFHKSNFDQYAIVTVLMASKYLFNTAKLANQR